MFDFMALKKLTSSKFILGKWYIKIENVKLESFLFGENCPLNFYFIVNEGLSDVPNRNVNLAHCDREKFHIFFRIDLWTSDGLVNP